MGIEAYQFDYPGKQAKLNVIERYTCNIVMQYINIQPVDDVVVTRDYQCFGCQRFATLTLLIGKGGSMFDWVSSTVSS